MRYSAGVEDHLTRPRNPGPLADASGVGRVTNDACGDALHLFLRLEDGHITAATFQASGCPPALAAGSVLTELVIGAAVDVARGMTPERVIEALGGLPRAKRHAAVLAIDALNAGLDAARA